MKRVFLIASLFLYGTGSALGAVDPEQVFRDAVAYTVKVRTRIETPFIEDERGTSEGAGFVVDAKRGWIMTMPTWSDARLRSCQLPSRDNRLSRRGRSSSIGISTSPFWKSTSRDPTTI